ncbi:HNH endonuclease [Pseudomonas syringae group sp. J309-1]|uniref:HNH endonuclease n=1 Tax=Pseudomonas syringae group sp. J309-1 TaxID=3079588 RepID=UPI003977A4A8
MLINWRTETSNTVGVVIAGRYVTADVAKGSQDSEGEQTQSKGGLKGGTTGGFKIGIGGSTGKASGKQFDVSATVVVGYGASASGSVGYGKTDGKTNWVGNQTSITAQDKLDIKTGEHTQLDGALISSNTGNLKLDTGTLGFSDIAGQDKERSYYLNMGGSYGLEGGQTQQDSSQVGKGNSGANGWSVEGYNYEKDRQQMVRGTIGAGDIVVRQDAATGKDSTAGLNRDVSKASEITRDEEHRTDLYVTKSSTDAVLSPVDTVNGWIGDAKQYGTRQERVLADGVNGIRASTLTSEDNPAEAKGLLGVEQSLAFGKKLVAGGMASGALNGVFTALDKMAKSAAELENCGEKCIQRVENNNATSSTISGPGRTQELPASPVNPEEFNILMEDAAEFSQTIPVTQIETAIAMAQVVMGPMKFIISTAASYAAKQVVGDQVDELKDQAAIKLVSFFTPLTEADVVRIDALAKEDYANKVKGAVFDGSTELIGAKFVVDTAVQTAIGGIGKAGGRIIGVVGSREGVDATTGKGGADDIPLINGRKPMNNQYAGSTHPSGVKFNKQGFPDFSPYAKVQVEIKGLTGNYTKDAAMANKAAGLKGTPDGYVWHHVEDAKTMQLITKEIHNAARHTGGAAVLRNQ